MPKFKTDQVLPVATEADLVSGRNVRGTLVYVDDQTFVDLQAAFDRAATAGAAGVLVASSLFPDWVSIEQLAARIPVLWLDADHADAVRNQVSGAHRVTATIRAELNSPFEYKLRYYELNQVSAQQTYSVRQRDLAAVETSYHAESFKPDASEMIEADHTFRPEDFFSFFAAHSFDGPTRRVEYYQPTDADVMWWRQYAFQSPDMARFSESFRRFKGVTRETESWNGQVVLAGQKRMGPQAANDVQPGFGVICAFCLQDDRIWLTPSLTGDGEPSHGVGGTETLSVQLFQGDQEIAIQNDPSGIPYYPVAGGANYQLRVVGEEGYDAQTLAKTTTTTWSFNARATSATREPVLCVGPFIGHPDPCGWLPLIYPQYQLPLDLDDTAAAGRKFDFTINAMTADPSGVPAVAGARVWVSYDDGKHWTQADVSGDHGVFQVQVVHPALKNTTGAVSIRTEIWDTAGNRVVQQIDRAYGLVAPRG
jgi:hypothetical protein